MATESGVEPTAKKPKLASNGDSATLAEHKFADFRVTKVLHEVSKQKTMFLEGRFGNNDSPAIVILEKTPFSEETAKSMLTKESETKEDIKNDIYHTYQLFPDLKLNGWWFFVVVSLCVFFFLFFFRGVES